MLIRNSAQLSEALGPGIKYSVKKVLPFAIVLMGAKLNFFDVLRVSGQALIVSVICVIVALGLTIWLCRRTGVGEKLGLLIGIGTAICGGTAIAVAAPTIEADDNDTAFAITTITSHYWQLRAPHEILGWKNFSVAIAKVRIDAVNCMREDTEMLHEIARRVFYL